MSGVLEEAANIASAASTDTAVAEAAAAAATVDAQGAAIASGEAAANAEIASQAADEAIQAAQTAASLAAAAAAQILIDKDAQISALEEGLATCRISQGELATRMAELEARFPPMVSSSLTQEMLEEIPEAIAVEVVDPEEVEEAVAPAPKIEHRLRRGRLL